MKCETDEEKESFKAGWIPRKGQAADSSVVLSCDPSDFSLFRGGRSEVEGLDRPS